MRSLLALYPGDAAVVLVANVCVQIAAVAAVAWLASRSLAARNPAARYGIWLCALLSVPLGALAAWGWQQTPWSLVQLPWLPAAASIEEEAAEAAESSAAASPAALTRLQASPPSPASGPAQGDLQPSGGPMWVRAAAALAVLAGLSCAGADLLRAACSALMVVWVAVASVLLVRLAWGWRMLAALRRRAQPIDPAKLAPVLARVRHTLGVSRLPPVRSCDRVRSPISLGVLRPLVILPAGLLERLDSRQWHDILVHECAHVLKHDHLVGLLQRLVQTVFWPHPLVYVLNRELGRAREEVCDNYVLHGGDSPCYARTLLALSQQAAAIRPALSAIGILHPHGRLEDRVAGLLDRRRRLATRLRSRTLAALAIGLLGVAGTIGAVRVVEGPPPDEPALQLAQGCPSDDAAQGTEPDGAAPIDPGALLAESGQAGSPLVSADPGTTAYKHDTKATPSEGTMVAAGGTRRLPAVAAAPTQPVVGPREDDPFMAGKGHAGAKAADVNRQVASAASAKGPAFAKRVAALAEAVAAQPLAAAARSNGRPWWSAVLRPSTDPSGPQDQAAPWPPEAVADLLAELQPMMCIEPEGRKYAVSLRLADQVESRIVLEPGKPGKMNLEEGVHEKLVFEIMLEGEEATEKVRATYRLSLQTAPEEFCEWSARQVSWRLGVWSPLLLEKVETSPSTATLLSPAVPLVPSQPPRSGWNVRDLVQQWLRGLTVATTKQRPQATEAEGQVSPWTTETRVETREPERSVK